MAKVWNKHIIGYPVGCVNIMRPNEWSNPFIIGRDGTREQVIEKYERYLHVSGLIRKIGELRGRDLLCCCAPHACHGDVLIRLANSPCK
jgi:hypothetical protein